MPSHKPKSSVTFEPRIYELLMRDAEFNTRPLATHIEHICKLYLAAKRNDAEVFIPKELPEGERRQVPVFETKRQHDAENSLKTRARLGQEES